MAQESRELTAEMGELIRVIARRVYRVHVPKWVQGQVTVGDLEHLGIIGWLEASRNYKPERNPDFKAFARWRIQGKMLDFLRKLPLVPLPQEQWEKVRTCRNAETELHQAGLEVSNHALAERLGWNTEVVAAVRALAPGISSLDAPVHGKEEGEAPSLELRDESHPEDRVLREELVQVIQRCIAALEPAEDRVILLGRFLEGLKLRELAEPAGCSEERVRQRLKRALERMRNCLESHGWDEIEEVNWEEELA